MVGFTLEDDSAAADPHDTFDNTDVVSPRLQTGCLFDVKFQVSSVLVARFGRVIVQAADALQFIPKHVPIGVGRSVLFVDVEDAGPRTTTLKCWLEASPLLVGPVDDLDWPARTDVLILERPYEFEGGDDAECSVEPATVGLTVEVGSHEDRRCVRICPGPPAEHISHLVDSDVEALMRELIG